MASETGATNLIRTLGLISDTHGLLRNEALKALRGCELLIHAGDVGNAEILDELATIAPVVAVRGNIDRTPPVASLPQTAVAEAADDSFYVLHDIEQLDLDPRAAGFAAVVYGHSHLPLQRQKAGVLYINPGSAGPRRFRLPVTVARMHRSGGKWEILFVDLISGLVSCEAPTSL